MQTHAHMHESTHARTETHKLDDQLNINLQVPFPAM